VLEALRTHLQQAVRTNNAGVEAIGCLCFFRKVFCVCRMRRRGLWVRIVGACCMRSGTAKRQDSTKKPQRRHTRVHLLHDLVVVKVLNHFCSGAHAEVGGRRQHSARRSGGAG